MMTLSRVLAIASIISGAVLLDACAVDNPEDSSTTSTETDDVIIGNIISVTQWQTDLRHWQIHFAICRPSVTVDGVFGSMTDSATRCFQRVEGITEDGDVGPQTFNTMCDELFFFNTTDFLDSHCPV